MPKSSGWAIMASVILTSLILAACQGQTVQIQVPVTVLVPQTQPVTQVQVQTQIVNVPVTLTPAPTPVNPKTMVICLGQEPTTLAWFKTDPVTADVLQAIYDGGIDNRDYQYQPVYYTKLPSFTDKDAGQVEVTVKDGDSVYDGASGSVVTLTKGVNLSQLDGSIKVYDGSGSATAVQTWAQWTLVAGLKWEDGTPVTADDQVFTFQTDSSPDLPSVDKSLISNTAKFEALDAKTTKWTGIPGYTDNTFFLNVWQPLPRQAYGKLTPAQMLQDETVNRKPLAFGPFKVDEWVAGDHITLSRNPSYWRASEGLPKLDKVIYRFVPDTNQLLAQLASGECNLGTQDSAFDSLLPLIKQFQSQKLMVPQIVAGTSFEHLDFNQKPGASYAGFAAKVKNADGTPIFANPEIRRAIADCLDRQALIDQAVNGSALAQDVFVPSSHPLYAGDANIVKYPFNKSAGLDLLAKNGWKDSNGDGVLDNGTGQDFSFVLSTRANTLREKTTQNIQAQLKTNCMIDVKIELYGSEFFQATRNSILQGMNYDVAEFAWPTGVEPPCDLYISDQLSGPATGWGGYDTPGYVSAVYDAACQGALAALDPAKKKDLHAQAQKIFTTDLPSLMLFARAKIAVTGPKVIGVIMDPTENTELWNVENFDVSQ
jgi:peptide/nickel transport system substrate-binding protein